MRITSSTVDAHQFTPVRKKGYDPAEVDAVMGRLVETLRDYEESTALLERRLRDAEESSEAIKRTFVAAQRTKDEMLDEARREAHSIKAKSKQEADATISATRVEVEAMLEKARVDAQALFDEATQILARATIEAEEIRAESSAVIEAARAKADSIRSQAEEVLTSSISEAETTRDEAEKYLTSHKALGDETLANARREAEALTETTRQQAETLLANARAEAADKLATSRREAEALIGSAVAEAKNVRSRVKAETDEILATRKAEAEELLTSARNESEELRSTAAAEAETTTSQARAEAEDLVKRAKTDAADRISSAQAQSEKILDHARGRAEDIVREAREEKLGLERRVAQLRTSVTDIERELHRLAETALERVSFVGGMIDLEQQSVKDVVAVGAAQAAATAGITLGAPAPISRMRGLASGPASTATLTEAPPREADVASGESPAEDRGHEPDRSSDEEEEGGVEPGHPEAEAPVATSEVVDLTATSDEGVVDLTDTATESIEAFPKAKFAGPEEATRAMAARRPYAFAAPDGSGRPPADRDVINPDSGPPQPAAPSTFDFGPSSGDLDREPRPETIYQRRGGGIRRRMAAFRDPVEPEPDQDESPRAGTE